jgi:hypothetical protein
VSPSTNQGSRFVGKTNRETGGKNLVSFFVLFGRKGWPYGNNKKQKQKALFYFVFCILRRRSLRWPRRQKQKLQSKNKKNPKQEGKEEKQQEDTAATSCVALCFETKISQMPLKL